MHLNMEMDSAAFTRITFRTPSDGAGRLERPIVVKANFGNSVGTAGKKLAD